MTPRPIWPPCEDREERWGLDNVGVGRVDGGSTSKGLNSAGATIPNLQWRQKMHPLKCQSQEPQRLCLSGWERSRAWGTAGPSEAMLERPCCRIGLFPRSGGQRGSFPGAQARGGPQAGHDSQNPIPEAPWSLGCSPQPGPFPITAPSLPLPGTAGWKAGEGARQLWLVLLFLWGRGCKRGAPTGQDVVGLWAAEASRLQGGCGAGGLGGGARLTEAVSTAFQKA